MTNLNDKIELNALNDHFVTCRDIPNQAANAATVLVSMIKTAAKTKSSRSQHDDWTRSIRRRT
jgi:hypothetical protein